MSKQPLWVPIPGFESLYEVSDDGRVRTVARHTGRVRVRARELRPSEQTSGYPRFRLMKGGKPYWISGHRLVALAFLGPPPSDDAVVMHLNGRRADNRVANLRWGTTAENQAQRKLDGTCNSGPNSVLAVLTVEQVVEMRERRAKGEKLIDLAAAYDVTPTTVSHICLGHTWVEAGGPIQRPFSRNAKRKLTDAQVEEIRRRRRRGEKIKAIAADFDIGWGYVSKLAKEVSNGEG